MVKIWSDTEKKGVEGIVDVSRRGPSEGSFPVYGPLEQRLFVRFMVEGDASKGFSVDRVLLQSSYYVSRNYQVIEFKYVGPTLDWKSVAWVKQV